jgi:hypothetical protein
MEIIQHLVDNSKSLIFDASNNSAEAFNALVAKFIGGKRVNYCKKKFLFSPMHCGCSFI